MKTTTHRLCVITFSIFLLAGNHVFSAGDDILETGKKDEPLRLSLDDCIELALERNLDVQLTGERLTEADTQTRQALATMLPTLSAEGSYTRLDEELSFAMGPQSLTFMDSDIFKAGLVVRQPIFTGGRLNAARKAA